MNEFIFPRIVLPTTGQYLIKFYILFNCNTENCMESTNKNDFLIIKIKFGQKENETISKYYNYENIEKENLWLEKNETFITSQKEIEVSLI